MSASIYRDADGRLRYRATIASGDAKRIEIDLNTPARCIWIPTVEPDGSYGAITYVRTRDVDERGRRIFR